MGKKVTIAAPCLRLYDLLQKFFESCERGTRKPDRYFVVDNGGGLPAKMASGEIKLPDSAMVSSSGKHIGVAGAWNLALKTFPDDWVIIANDDVVFQENTVEALVSAAETNEDEFFYPVANENPIFCVFLMKHSLWTRVGGFDEQFHPAYFDDNDFHYRMKLLGVTERMVESTSYEHVGSATLKSFSDLEKRRHHDEFNRNKDRYIEKWGSVPGLEAFTEPFNGKHK